MFLLSATCTSITFWRRLSCYGVHGAMRRREPSHPLELNRGRTRCGCFGEGIELHALSKSCQGKSW